MIRVIRDPDVRGITGSQIPFASRGARLTEDVGVASVKTKVVPQNVKRSVRQGRDRRNVSVVAVGLGMIRRSETHIGAVARVPRKPGRFGLGVDLDVVDAGNPIIVPEEMQRAVR